MNVVLVEDESLIAKNLERLLKEIDPAIEVVAALDSVAGTVKWLEQHKQPDLFFFDIQLADGISFDIFEKVKITSPVIFTTAYNEYAIRAFKVNSVDYLLKPIDKDHLENALNKYKRLFGSSTGLINEQIKLLINNLNHNNTPKYKERFLAHYKSGMVPVTESQVAYFVKETIIYLVTITGEKLVTDYNTIDEIEEMVNPRKFFRANRQMIIGIDQVETYRKQDTGKIEVHLRCDKNIRVDVSREKANEFTNWLES
ncbi:MAG: LytTR family DNA-binding domain-containing protein [Chitinophagales bacterium]